jgi:DNA replication protein DnaC
VDASATAAAKAGQDTCATALIDRTVHHADVIAIEGDSYRRREAETDKKARRTKKAA